MERGININKLCIQKVLPLCPVLFQMERKVSCFKAAVRLTGRCQL